MEFFNSLLGAVYGTMRTLVASGFTSEAGIDNKITSEGAPCNPGQSPVPPYTWTAQPYTPNSDLKVFITPDISATFYLGSGCTSPSPRTFFGQKQQILTCPAGWTSGLYASTTNYPYGYCYRPPVQRDRCIPCEQPRGDLIDPTSGNAVKQEVDYSGGASNPLEFVRTYSYAGVIIGPGTPQGAVGQGWSHSYERSLWFYAGGSIRALRPDGNHRLFSLVSGNYQEYGTAVDHLTAIVSGGTTTGYQLVTTDDTNETYDVSGKLLSITYRGGRTVSLSYSTSSTSSSIAPYPGLLITASDVFGHQLNFTYNSQGQILTMTDPNGAVFTYTYSGTLLSAVAAPDSTSRQYRYNESTYTGGANLPYALTGIIDEAGTRYATVSYNASAQGVSSSLAGGIEQFSFAGYGVSGSESVQVTDPLGQFRRFSYSALSNGVYKFGGSTVVCPICPDAAKTLTYDTNGNVASKTDFNGNQSTYSYDLTRNLETSRTEAYGTSLARTITTSWDTNWREPDSITEPNRTTSLTYDSMGNVLTKTITDTTVTPNVSRTWTYTYDSYGRMLTADGPGAGDTYTYTYYTCTTGSQCGELDTVSDPVGNVTTYNTYNAYGQPLTITDANGVVTTLTYDSRLRLMSRKVGTETTSFSYYPIGLLETITLPDSSTITYTYDSAHRLTKIADGAGNYISYTLDAMGDRTAEKSYDPSSTLHRTHTRTFNTLSLLYTDINAAGTSAVTTTYTYDSNSNQTAIAAPLTRNTTNAYDQLNRLNQITDPNSGVTKFTYDAADDLTSVKDPRSLTTSYSYNGFGDVTQLVSPDTGTSTNTYDAVGNLSVATDARGSTANYSYDAANRVTQIVYKDNTGTTDQTLTFGYDSGTYGKGRLTSSGDGNHALSWTYDFAGRVTGKGLTVGTLNLSIGYGYTNGDLTAITTPSGQTVTYSYNTNHQVTGISVNSTTVLGSVTYEPFGGVNGWTWGDSTSVSRTFNGDGLISQIVTAGVTLGYTFDNANRITGISDSSSSSLTWTYGYDVLDRLTSASTTANSYGWTYDANGNRTAQTTTGATTFTVSSTSNQLSSTTGSLVRTYVYDAAGHTQGYGSYTFGYNNRGRMAGTSAASTQYLYNALGQMYEKSGTAGTTYLMYDEAGHIIGEYNSSGGLIEETVWLGDLPVATLQPNGSGGINIFYIHTDHLNTPKKIAQPTSGTLAWRWDTDPIGMATPNQNPGGLGTFVYNLRMPGQYYQAETGLNYNYFRDYDPLGGGYIQSDPMGPLAGVGTYTYADNDSVSNKDPSGKCPWCIGAAIGAISGGIGGYVASGGSWKEAAISAGVGAVVGAVNPFAAMSVGEAIEGDAIGGYVVRASLNNTAANYTGQVAASVLKYGNLCGTDLKAATAYGVEAAVVSVIAGSPAPGLFPNLTAESFGGMASGVTAWPSILNPAAMQPASR